LPEIPEIDIWHGRNDGLSFSWSFKSVGIFGSAFQSSPWNITQGIGVHIQNLMRILLILYFQLQVLKECG
jgi:hypothetical protein